MFQHVRVDEENYRLQYVNKSGREVIEFDRKFSSPNDVNQFVNHIRNTLKDKSDLSTLQALRYNYTYSVKSVKV